MKQILCVVMLLGILVVASGASAQSGEIHGFVLPDQSSIGIGTQLFDASGTMIYTTMPSNVQYNTVIPITLDTGFHTSPFDVFPFGKNPNANDSIAFSVTWLNGVQFHDFIAREAKDGMSYLKASNGGDATPLLQTSPMEENRWLRK